MSTADRKSAGWMKWALIGSLALNLLVLGAVVGAGIGHRIHDRREGGRDIGFGPYSALLAPEDREALRRSFLADGPGPAAMRRAARDDFEALAEALRRDPFDPAAVRLAVTRQSERANTRMETGARLLIERLLAMPVEARHALADRIEAAMRRHDDD